MSGVCRTLPAGHRPLSPVCCLLACRQFESGVPEPFKSVCQISSVQNKVPICHANSIPFAPCRPGTTRHQLRSTKSPTIFRGMLLNAAARPCQRRRSELGMGLIKMTDEAICHWQCKLFLAQFPCRFSASVQCVCGLGSKRPERSFASLDRTYQLALALDSRHVTDSAAGANSLTY